MKLLLPFFRHHKLKFSSQKGFALPGILLVLAAIAVLAVVGFFASGYLQKSLPASSPQISSGKPMRIAQVYWPGMYWADIADKKGFFKAAGLDVEMVYSNDDYFGSMEKTIKGEIDTNCFFTFDLVKANTNGADLAIVVVSDLSYGADGIVAKKHIKTLRDLKGKKVGVPIGTYNEYLLDVALERSGLPSTETTKPATVVDVKPENIALEFKKGELDAVSGYDPYLTQALENGQGHLIFDTTQIPGISYAVYPFSKKFIEERPEDVQRFVNVWRKATEYMKSNPKESYQIIADIYKVTPQEVEEFTKKDRIMDLSDNRTVFTKAEGLESIYGAINGINQFLKENGERKVLDPAEHIDDKFIKSVVN